MRKAILIFILILPFLLLASINNDINKISFTISQKDNGEILYEYNEDTIEKIYNDINEIGLNISKNEIREYLRDPAY
ncbi:hypothetical protein K8R66_04170, partial [bacterium]|nr:hypothetical protein [bacterium]